MANDLGHCAAHSSKFISYNLFSSSLFLIEKALHWKLQASLVNNKK